MGPNMALRRSCMQIDTIIFLVTFSLKQKNLPDQDTKFLGDTILWCENEVICALPNRDEKQCGEIFIETNLLKFQITIYMCQATHFVDPSCAEN
eukprot:TRINITY_DN14409_c0_g1_i1.p1 TRINITY_DN14409_c0_g1~~TRINITY_DN14409_c0_g1_i1.p1  ORF type:complete len:94 (-),score=12.79 TRINITY_DN14409_c0_g1_i1:203-484(-)